MTSPAEVRVVVSEEDLKACFAVRREVRFGYVAHGPEFQDAGIPHRAMRRSLP